MSASKRSEISFIIAIILGLVLGILIRRVRLGLEAIGMRGNDVLIVSRRKPNGMYGFPANWLEGELGVAATARNWSTVRKLVELSRR